MIYQNKENPEITASLDFENPKFMTVNMIYLTGPEKGKSFTITNSTLHNKWREKPIDEAECKSFLDTIDMKKVNEPYPEPKFQTYIPVPKSVLEYEASKIKKKKCTFNKPENYDVFADILAERGVKIARVNSGYIALPDTSKLKLLTTSIGILSANDLAVKFVTAGFVCKPCPEKGTPFRFDICTQEEYDKMLEVLSNVGDEEATE